MHHLIKNEDYISNLDVRTVFLEGDIEVKPLC